jgi:hypothetical protein
MLDKFESALPSFRKRLTETIAWCTSKHLESNPPESAEVKERRKLGEEAAKLAHRAYLTDKKFWKSILYRRARGLWAKAKLHEIIPLRPQLRSPILQSASSEFPRNRLEQIQMVDDLAQRRGEHLRFEQRYPSDPASNLQGGRLLLYAPDENLFDGAAEVQSKGFFDVNNIPPWDTWICFFEQYLVSWVPPKLLKLANAGIDVNPEGCIFWAPETGL